MFYSPPRTIPPGAAMVDEDDGPKVVIAAGADPRRAPTMPIIRFRAPPLPQNLGPAVTPFAMPPQPPAAAPGMHSRNAPTDRPPASGRPLPPAVAVPPRRVAPAQPPAAKIVLFVGIFLFLATMGLVTLLVLRARGASTTAPASSAAPAASAVAPAH